MVIDQLAQFGVPVTNLEEIQSNLNLATKVADRMAYGQADVLEKFVAKTAVEGVAAANNLGDYSTALTSSTIYAAIESMRVALAEQNAFDQAALFVAPEIASLIRQSSLFDGFREGLDVRKAAYVGRMAGFEIYESNNIGYNKMLAFDKYAVHFAAQWMGYKTEAAQLGFRDNILGEMAYGAKVCTENKKRICTYAYLS